MQELKPTQMPPAKANAGSTIAGSQPRELTTVELANISTERTGSMPSFAPPQGSENGGVTATWVSDKRINALWSINENRNVWIGVDGIGWKKLADNSDSAIMALTILAAHARLMQSRYDYFEADDGKITQCYVW
jgi:hypothetical protein